MKIHKLLFVLLIAATTLQPVHADTPRKRVKVDFESETNVVSTAQPQRSVWLDANSMYWIAGSITTLAALFVGYKWMFGHRALRQADVANAGAAAAIGPVVGNFFGDAHGGAPNIGGFNGDEHDGSVRNLLAAFDAAVTPQAQPPVAEEIQQQVIHQQGAMLGDHGELVAFDGDPVEEKLEERRYLMESGKIAFYNKKTKKWEHRWPNKTEKKNFLNQ